MNENPPVGKKQAVASEVKTGWCGRECVVLYWREGGREGERKGRQTMAVAHHDQPKNSNSH